MEIIYDREATVKAKESMSNVKNMGMIWKNYFSGSNHIGNCTNLFRILQPNTHEDFIKKYLSYAEENKSKPITDRGLTSEELYNLVKEYKRMGDVSNGLNIDFEYYMNDALCHIITETFDGKIQEKTFKDYLTSKGYDCEYVEGKLDGKFGVDIMAHDNSGKSFGVQIKPVSFFMSHRKDVYLDRISLCRKYELFFNNYGIKTYYAIYNKQVNGKNVLWAFNDNGGYSFKIKELFSYDKNNLENTFKDKSYNFNFQELKF